MLVKLLENEWNDETQKLLDKAFAISYGDSTIAILSERVFTYLNHETDNVDEIVEECKNRMEAVLSTHPDFSYQPLDEDDCGLVVLENGMIITMLYGEEAKNEEGKEQPPMGELMIYRGMGLYACEQEKVIAVFIPDENTKTIPRKTKED